MKRRELLQQTATFSLLAAVPFLFRGGDTSAITESAKRTSPPNPLTPPAHGPILTAFLISEGAAVIDFCGPWEVFQDVRVSGHPDQGFQVYTVAETLDPIQVSGGMKITPN